MYAEASVRITVAGEPAITGGEAGGDGAPARAAQGSGWPSPPVWTWAIAAVALLVAAAGGWRYRRRLGSALRRPPAGGTDG